jgi:hypothetical protein
MQKREYNISWKSKKSQITLFVILAIIIVVIIAGYFILRSIYFPEVPKAIAPVNDYYLSCVKAVASEGANIMESQGGYIELPDFEAGSDYAPFSNQLGFMGMAVPYWYYISGNGVAKEQVPTKASMQEQLANYIEGEINNKCDFGSFKTQGFEVYLNPGGISAKTTINTDAISVSVNQEMIVVYENSTYTINSHSAQANSHLGRFYDLAKKIYDYEQSRMFLENYSSDVLYTYAPVSGAEISCAPKIWNPTEVFSGLRTALEQNIQMLKVQGDYYTSANEHTPYFIVGKGSDLKTDTGTAVNFVYSKAWPSRLEVWPTENDLMIANPVGNQPGLSAMGFCYVPYKFVYDVYFPVLIQVYNPSDATEVFQFPVAVVLNKNVPREALDSGYIEPVASICNNANTQLSVYTYDIHLNPIEANIKFKCLTDVCHLGITEIDNETGSFSLEKAVPQCANGVLIASADGYREEKYPISTNEKTLAEIILAKKYKMALEIYIDGALSNDFSVLTINDILGENDTEYAESVSYPSTKTIELAEGNYNFDLKVYKGSSITIPATTRDYCAKIPRGGVLGLFGLEEEQCMETTIPSQTVSNILGAGGKINYYAGLTELENAQVMRVYATSIKQPASVEEIGAVYDQIEKQNIDIEFV